MAQQERRGFFATLRGFFGGAEVPIEQPPLPPPLPAPNSPSAPSPAVSPSPPQPVAGVQPPTLVVAPALQWPRPQPAPGRETPVRDTTYRQRDGLLTPAERTFFQALRTGVGDRWHIVTKVRLADLVAPLPGREWQAAWNRIAAKHVDFALCEPDTLRPRLVIELDDRSHRRPDRVERDAFVDRVFAEAALPILHVPVRRSYEPSGLAGQIAAIIATPPNGAPHTYGTQASHPVEAAPPGHCARCGGELRRRVAKRGERAGEVFWGCANYPRCRHIVPIRA